MKTYVFFILLILVGHTSFAQVHINETSPIVNNLILGANPDDITLNLTDPVFNLDYKINKGLIFIKSFITDAHNEYVLGDEDRSFNINVSFKLSAISKANIELASYSKVLDLSNKAPEQWEVVDFSKFINLTDKISKFVVSDINVSIGNITFWNLLSADIKSKILTQLHIQISAQQESQVDVKKNSALQNIKITSPTCTKITSRVVKFEWNNQLHTFPNYELQILRLYNTSIVAPSSDEAITATINWANAIKIETHSSANVLTVSLAEGTGYYIWRVRPIGTYYTGEIADSRNWGTWSLGTTSVAYGSEGSSVNMSATTNWSANTSTGLFYLKDPEDNKNWIYSRVFTEGNHIAESMTFANGLYHVKQTQRYLPSKQTSLITQTVHDLSGRPVVQTLPVPIPFNSTSTLNYKSNLLSGFGPNNFDSDTKVSDPDPIDMTTNFSYYNGKNESVADAQGYPYTRVVYYKDGSGRIKEQSGVGLTNSISTVADRGKTTKYYYSSATDLEMIALFGEEAPIAESVLKTTTVDPNGVASYTFTSKDGKVLATALANENNATALEDLTTDILDFDSNNKKNKLSLKSKDGLIVAKRVSFPKQKNATFSYQFNSCKALKEGISSACVTGSCSYKLAIKIYNVNDGSLVGHYERDIVSTDCGTNEYSVNISLNSLTNKPDVTTPLVGTFPTLTFPIGDYVIVKELKVNDVQITDGVNQTLEPVVKLINYWLASQVTRDADGINYDNFFTKIDDIKAVPYIPGKVSQTELTAANVALTPSEFDDIIIPKLEIKVNGTPKFDRSVEIKDIQHQDCCPVVIQIENEPPFICPNETDLGIESLYTLGTYNPSEGVGLMDFGGYFIKQLEVNNIDLTGEIFLNGFQGYGGLVPTNFNKMIYNMANDKYICTFSSNPDDPDVPGPQYQCKDLWSCWINVVGAYIDAYEESNTGFITEGESGGDGSDSDDSDYGETGTQDNHFDEESEGSPIVSWLAGVALSGKMEKKKIYPSFNLAKQFLECTGYKFAAILDNNGVKHISNFSSNIVTYTDPIDNITDDGELTLCLKKPKNNSCIDNDADPDDGHGSINIYPYITDPTYAFKYYYYPMINNTAWDMDVKKTCERMYDFYPPDPPAQRCQDPIMMKDKNAWTCADRYKFYKCISTNAGELPEATAEEKALNLTVFNCTTASLLYPSIAASKTKQAASACDNKKDVFRAEVTKKFKENDFIIVDCPSVTAPNEITFDVINSIVNSIITECKEHGTIVVADLTCTLKTYPCADPPYSAPEISLNDGVSNSPKKRWEEIVNGTFEISFNPTGESCSLPVSEPCGSESSFKIDGSNNTNGVSCYRTILGSNISNSLNGVTP